MEVSEMELSSIPKGEEQVIDSPKLDATTRENRMAKEAILLLIILPNDTRCSKLFSPLQNCDLSH